MVIIVHFLKVNLLIGRRELIMKKIGKIILLFAVVLGFMKLSVQPVLASGNKNPKELTINITDIKVKNAKLKTGNKLSLSMRVKGNGYTAIKTVSARYHSSRAQSLNIPLKYNTKSGLWSSSFKIPKGMQSGLWKLVSVAANVGLDEDGDLEAQFGRKKAAKQILSKGNIRISGTRADYTRPKIDFKSLSSSKKVTESRGGGYLTYRVKVTDKSPIKSVVIEIAEMEAVGEYYDDYYRLEMKYNKKKGYFESTAWYPKGIYHISSIRAEDIFGNYEYYCNKAPEFDNMETYKKKDFSKYILEFDK